MRQIFSSARLENVEAVARMLNEAGVQTYTSDGRSYKGTQRMHFSYRDNGEKVPAVWIVNSRDITRARELMVESGLLDRRRSEETIASLERRPAVPVGAEASRRALVWRIRLSLVAVAGGIGLWTLLRAFGLL
jgi:hypothetical protein